MKESNKIFINLEEFQDFILKYIISEDFEKAFQSTRFYQESNSTDFFDAMQHGIVWASLLMASSEIPKYYGET